MCPVRKYERCLLVLVVVDVPEERNHLGCGRRTPPQQQRKRATHARERVVVVEIPGCGDIHADAERLRSKRIAGVDLGGPLTQGAVNQHRARACAVSGNTQGKVGDTGRRGERIRLRSDADAHVGPAEEVGVARGSLLIEVKTFDPNIFGLGRAEPARVGRAIETDSLRAHHRSKCVSGCRDRVLASPLRPHDCARQRRGKHEERSQDRMRATRHTNLLCGGIPGSGLRSRRPGTSKPSPVTAFWAACACWRRTVFRDRCCRPWCNLLGSITGDPLLRTGADPHQSVSSDRFLEDRV
jgi:hypothetical protein